MFFYLFKSELKYWLTNWTTWFYFIIFFSLTLLIFIGTAGFFDPPTESEGPTKLLNSPSSINYMLLYFNKFLMFLLPVVVGASVYRDFKHKTYSILYSYPFNKLDYLLAKFAASFTVVFILSLSIGLAMILGEHFPNLDENVLGEIRYSAYFQSYWLYLIP
ncbi:MAG: hypothetical protein AAF391_04650, partial [Bacteroidota bacterium]